MNTAHIAVMPIAIQTLVFVRCSFFRYPTHVRVKTTRPTFRSNDGLLRPPWAASATGPKYTILRYLLRRLVIVLHSRLCHSTPASRVSPCKIGGSGRFVGKNEAAGAADARLCHILGPWAR